MNPLTAWGVLFSMLLAATHGTAFGQIRFSKNLLKNDAAWFHSDEARRIAESVLQYQSPQGGWPKPLFYGLLWNLAPEFVSDPRFVTLPNPPVLKSWQSDNVNSVTQAG